MLAVPVVKGQDKPEFTRTEDVVYGRKFGTALTMDVFTPRKEANGLGVVFVVSGGWFSSHEGIPLGYVEPLVGRVSEIGDAVMRYYRGVITKMIPRRPIYGSATGQPGGPALI